MISANTLKAHWGILRSVGEPHSLLLPPSAAGPVFHIDPDLLFGSSLAEFDSLHEATFDSLQRHTAAAHRSSRLSSSRDEEIQDLALPYVLCGPQTSAKQVRHELEKWTGRARHRVGYTSRHDDVACWNADLNQGAADALLASSLFFHVSPVPSIAKLSPGLVRMVKKRSQAVIHELELSEHFLGQGVRVHFTDDLRSHTQEAARAELLQGWADKAFGFSGSHAHAESFFPTSSSSHGDLSVWKSVHGNMGKTNCAAHFDVSTLDFRSFLHLQFRSRPAAAADIISGVGVGVRGAGGGPRRDELSPPTLEGCGLLALSFLATQPKVRLIEVGGPKKLHTRIPDEVGRHHHLPPSLPVARRTEYVAATALQSGSSSNPTPIFDAGINGDGEFVQVADTGFDDGSCFFREANSKFLLSGPFNDAVQIARSNTSTPYTDKERRKIVQYISTGVPGSSLNYDCYNCQGSHVAGTIAGSIDPSDSSTPEIGDTSTSCGSVCPRVFCANCNDEGQCAGLCATEVADSSADYSGMAPNAKLMVVDLGNSVGTLSIPTDFDSGLFRPAYDQGAKISSNSWGGDSYYSSDSIQVDTLAYELNDFLLVFSAGDNDDDEVGVSAGGTVSEPGTAKNCLTVGAAETVATPDTVASFSPRGPTRDLRIKPDLVAPGDVVYSAMASGSFGASSCKITAQAGTAPAAAGAAGTAVLLRQFLVNGSFHENFSPVGFAASSYSAENPSGALLKAMLISSGNPLTFGYDSSQNPVTLSNFYGGKAAFSDAGVSVNTALFELGTPGRDFSQGHGHIRVVDVLPVDQSFELFLFEDELAEYNSITTSFTVSSVVTDLKVTLVWNDPPAYESCDYFGAGACLVHDLDLVVKHQGVQLYPNFGAASNGTFSGQEDDVNNVEVVSISLSDLTVGDTVVVAVAANGLAYADTQKFALVVTGGLSFVANSKQTVASFQPTLMPTLCIRTRDAVVLESGACTLDASNLCMFSPSYPGLYSNSEQCVFNVKSSGYLQIESFDTEQDADFVHLKKRDVVTPYSSFSGLNGPSGVDVAEGDNIVFVTNEDTQASGFHMCIIQPTCQPTLAPTSSLYPTSLPTPAPTIAPSPSPTPAPTPRPSPIPTSAPTFSVRPTEAPTPAPTFFPTIPPSPVPTMNATIPPRPSIPKPPPPRVGTPDTAGTCNLTCLVSIGGALVIVLMGSLYMYAKGQCKESGSAFTDFEDDEAGGVGGGARGEKVGRVKGEKKLTKLQQIRNEEKARKRHIEEKRAKRKAQYKNPYRTKSLDRIHNIFDDLQKLRKQKGKKGKKGNMGPEEQDEDDDDIDLFSDSDLRGVSLVRNDDQMGGSGSNNAARPGDMRGGQFELELPPIFRTPTKKANGDFGTVSPRGMMREPNENRMSPNVSPRNAGLALSSPSGEDLGEAWQSRRGVVGSGTKQSPGHSSNNNNQYHQRAERGSGHHGSRASRDSKGHIRSNGNGNYVNGGSVAEGEHTTVEDFLENGNLSKPRSPNNNRHSHQHHHTSPTKGSKFSSPKPSQSPSHNAMFWPTEANASEPKQHSPRQTARPKKSEKAQPTSGDASTPFELPSALSSLPSFGGLGFAEPKEGANKPKSPKKAAKQSVKSNGTTI
jgi:hypothetical protein